MKHKHAELMMQYAQDAMTTDKPWELWEARAHPKHDWFVMKGHPCWSVDFEYRRKPKKTKEQVARELLTSAYETLAKAVTALNIEDLEYVESITHDARLLLLEPEGVAVTPPSRKVFSCTVQREVAALTREEAAWHLREIVASGATEVVVADKSGVVTWEMGIRPKGV